MSARVGKALRAQVRQRADACCEYCLNDPRRIAARAALMRQRQYPFAER